MNTGETNMDAFEYIVKECEDYERGKVLEAISWMESTLSRFYGLNVTLTSESRMRALTNKRDSIALYLSWRNWQYDDENFTHVIRLIESYLRAWSN